MPVTTKGSPMRTSQMIAENSLLPELPLAERSQYTKTDENTPTERALKVALSLKSPMSLATKHEGMNEIKNVVMGWGEYTAKIKEKKAAIVQE